MKTKLLFIACALLMACNLQAQAPEKFNYQGIARSSSGDPLANQTLGVQISILDGSTAEYVETHTVTTNGFGLYTLQIGTGTPVSGTMSGVTWSTGNKFIKVGIDPNGGSNYTVLGTTELLSVPYALYAAAAPGGGGGAPTGAAGGDLAGTYPNPSIANDAITSAKIKDASIVEADLADKAVTAAKLNAMGATNGQVLKFDGTKWAPANDDPGAAGWQLGGNAATANDFIGTTNDENLRFKVNNEKAGMISSDGSKANTSFGIRTLSQNTTGVYNTAMGYVSLVDNTTGIGNVAFGYATLQANTDGAENTAIGQSSLFDNLAGSRNTGIGNRTLANNTIGNWNTASGAKALYSNISGNYNTALGSKADVSTGNLTNATAIGANAFVEQDNSLVLGSINGVNDASADTKVGIGTTTPDKRLDVNGDTNISGTLTVGNGVEFSDGSVQTTAAFGPIAFGTVLANGTITNGSGNFTVSYNTTYGWYEITITNVNYYYKNFSSFVTPVTAIESVETSSASSNLLVILHDETGAETTGVFNFIVYE